MPASAGRRRMDPLRFHDALAGDLIVVILPRSRVQGILVGPGPCDCGDPCGAKGFYVLSHGVLSFYSHVWDIDVVSHIEDAADA